MTQRINYLLKLKFYNKGTFVKHIYFENINRIDKKYSGKKINIIKFYFKLKEKIDIESALYFNVFNREFYNKKVLK